MKTKEIKLRIGEYQPIRFYNNRFDDIYNEALEKYNEKYFNQSINLLEVYIDKVFNFFYEPYYTLSKIYGEIGEKDKSLLYKELGDFVLTVRKGYNNKLIEKSFLKCQKYISKFPQEKILVSTLNLSSFFLGKPCVYLSKNIDSLYYNFSLLLFKENASKLTTKDYLFSNSDFLFKPIFLRKKGIKMEQMELLYQSLQYEALITIISGVQNSSREQTYGAIGYLDNNKENAAIALLNAIDISGNQDKYYGSFLNAFIHLQPNFQRKILKISKKIFSKKNYILIHKMNCIHSKKVNFNLYIDLYEVLSNSGHVSEKDIFILFNKSWRSNVFRINKCRNKIIKVLGDKKLIDTFKYHDVYQIIYPNTKKIRPLISFKGANKRNDIIIKKNIGTIVK